ncbi:MAG: RNA 2'-phosphotransferase [Candidatus Lokiarchaeota archaeon]|nr:RNA 2'-phosphotransferase [Candidatus Lokiarchaeota archaeon]
MKKEIRISKFLSYVLRHNPNAINSTLDNFGYLQIKLDELINRMRQLKQFTNFNLNKSDIINIVENDPKGRYEIQDDKIRARYGHSIDGIRLFLSENEVPPILFHGTIKENVPKILKAGLKPMKRNLVHLTETINDAILTGRRHGQNVVLLSINAKEAIKENVKIWKPGKNVYTVLEIPAKFISIYKEEKEKI